MADLADDTNESEPEDWRLNAADSIPRHKLADELLHLDDDLPDEERRAINEHAANYGGY